MRLNLRRAGLTVLACAAAIPVLAFARVQGDPNASCVSNAKQVALGVLMYCQDYDEKFPPMKPQAKFQNVVNPYIKNKQIFLCPASNKPFALNTNLHQKAQASIASPATTVLLFDPAPHPDGMFTVAYTDGHVKRESKVPSLGAATTPKKKGKK